MATKFEWLTVEDYSAWGLEAAPSRAGRRPTARRRALGLLAVVLVGLLPGVTIRRATDTEARIQPDIAAASDHRHRAAWRTNAGLAGPETNRGTEAGRRL